MVTCPICQQPMYGTSCREVRAIAFGAEPDWEPGQPSGPCRDCGTTPGGRHHHGCCVALCALGCLNELGQPEQALFCDHAEGPDGGDGDELPAPYLPPPTPAVPLFT